MPVHYPWVLLKQMSLSALRSTATRRATLRAQVEALAGDRAADGEMSTRPC